MVVVIASVCLSTLYKINKMISCLVRDEGPLLLPNFEILKLYDQTTTLVKYRRTTKPGDPLAIKNEYCNVISTQRKSSLMSAAKFS